MEIDTSEDDRHCSDDSEEYGSDDECIDILNGNNSDALSPGSEEQKEESCDGAGNANKFSIDTILGLKSKESECGKADDVSKCNKTAKFIKPTPVPALPRGKLFLAHLLLLLVQEICMESVLQTA